MVKIKQIKIIKVVQRLLGILVVVVGLGGCFIKPTHIRTYYPSTITLNDGKILEGTTDGIYNYGFHFKGNDNKRVSIENKNVETVVKQFPDKTIRYETIEWLANSKTKSKLNILAAKEETGKLSLYSYEIIRYYSTPSVSASLSSHNSQTYVVTYYLKKGNEPATKVTAEYKIQKQKFITFAQNYFQDEPSLALKIGQTGYELRDLKKIVQEYNQIKNKQ